MTRRNRTRKGGAHKGRKGTSKAKYMKSIAALRQSFMPIPNMHAMNTGPRTNRSTRKAVMKFSSKQLHQKMSAAQKQAAAASAKSAKGFHGRMKAQQAANRMQKINELSDMFGRMGH